MQLKPTAVSGVSPISASLTVSVHIPPLRANVCGWLMKMSTGLLSAGTWKKKWIVLCGNKIWHYESPWHMEHVKGVILCANVLSLEIDPDGVSLRIKFIEQEGKFGDKKISKAAEKTWELRWDPDSSRETKRTWRRKLVAACPRLLRQELKRQNIRAKKGGFDLTVEMWE